MSRPAGRWNVSTVITEADRHVEGVPITRLFDKSDGATRIWMINVALSTPGERRDTLA